MIRNWLRLLYERRISVPLDAEGLMLDVGCGDKPHWRADILVDKFLDDTHAGQRNTGGSVKASAPLFESPLESLPFKDKAFDFVYCSHVLEHVLDPAAAVSELLRVGKCGYIEVPYAGIQKMYDQETHLWYCDRQGDTLTFVAKDSIAFDKDIECFLNSGPLQPIAFILGFYPQSAMIRLSWSERTPIAIRVVGTANTKLLEQGGKQKPARLRLWPIVRKALRMIFFWKVRREPITFNSITKPQYHRRPDELLTTKIYRSDTFVGERRPSIFGEEEYIGPAIRSASSSH